jgi:hypothetical protein
MTTILLITDNLVKPTRHPISFLSLFLRKKNNVSVNHAPQILNTCTMPRKILLKSINCLCFELLAKFSLNGIIINRHVGYQWENGYINISFFHFT